MNKYNKNRTKIGDEEIESTKNFGKLMDAYNTASPTAKPKLYNKTLLWSAAASIIIVVGIIAYNYIKTDTVTSATKAFVSPPIAGVNIPDTTLKINAETGGTIILPSGSMIEIPANAFVNLDGSAIKGIVDLKYREFRKPTEFFVSGIPMTYDSAGTKYTFESAGMFDLNGFAGSSPIKIADGKSVNVKMSSIHNEDRYNKYILDTVKKSWVYLGKSDPIAIGLEKPELKDTSSIAPSSPMATKDYNTKTILVPGELVTVPKEMKPAKPAKVESMKNTFKLEVDPNEFPEIAVYKDVLFEIPLPQYNKLPANFDNTAFDDIQIVRSNTEGYYNFSLVKRDKSGESKTYNITNCRPVFTEKDYGVAMETYNTLYSKYQNRYKGKVLQQDRDQKKLAAEEAKAQEAYANYEESRAKFAKKQAEVWAKQITAINIQNLGYRAFQVRQFGMYNSDCPSNMPTGATVFASVTDDKGNKISYSSLYMVDHGRNALYTIYTTNGKANLSFNPESSTTFWVVTSDGKIAILDPEAVKKLNPKREGINQLTFAMHVSEKELKTEADIASYLNLN